jgi:hypothetical protein
MNKVYFLGLARRTRRVRGRQGPTEPSLVPLPNSYLLQDHPTSPSQLINSVCSLRNLPARKVISL